MSDTITLPRAEYEALLDRLEDAEDAAALAAHRAREQALGAETARRNNLSIDQVERLMAGESPVRIWRQHRGLSQSALASSAAVSPTYLNEIETGKKPGSVDAISKIARSLGVAMEDLLPWPGDEVD